MNYNEWGNGARLEDVQGLDGKEVTLHVAEDQGVYHIFAHDADTNVIYFLTEWSPEQ